MSEKVSEIVDRFALRFKMDAGQAIYFHPIPERKLSNAVATHHGIIANDVLLLHDTTFFGGAEDGAILTSKTICAKNRVL